MAPKAGLDRTQVIDAAARLVDRDGLEALSMATLASELGVRTPSLYNHIDGLPGLRRALGLRTLDLMQRRLTTAALGLAGADAVRAAAHAYRQLVLEHPGMYAASLRAPTLEPEDTELREASNAVLGVLTAILGAQQLDQTALVHVLRAFRSMVHGFAVLESAGGFGLPVDLDTSFERMVELLLAALPPADA